MNAGLRRGRRDCCRSVMTRLSLGFARGRPTGAPHIALPPRTATRGGRFMTKGRIANMPRAYEAVYLFDSTLEDAAISDKLTRFHGLLGAAEDLSVDHWGRRQLAYPIGTKENGYYVIAHFGVDPKVLPEFERALKLDDG